MTALAAARSPNQEAWNRKELILASGHKAWKGGIASLNLATGKVEPGASEGNRMVIGTFVSTVDATSADKACEVDFEREIRGRWWANSGTSAVGLVGSICYVQDDQTVASVPTTGAPIAGRVWAVSATRGVFVEKLDVAPELAPSIALSAFSSNNINVPDNPTPGAVHDIPATGAASTVTLPATAVEGESITFVADGTKNAHTVTYRDATGPTNLTAALTASKRHQVIATFLNSKWTAIAHVSP